MGKEGRSLAKHVEGIHHLSCKRKRIPISYANLAHGVPLWEKDLARSWKFVIKIGRVAINLSKLDHILTK